MKTLYILGAGASHGHGVREYPKPPTVYEFFQERFISKLKDKYGPLWEILYSAIEETKSPIASINIEQLFSLVEPVWELTATANLSIESIEKWNLTDFITPLDILRSWIVDVIHISTRWLRNRDCPFHKILANRAVERNESIISFNYDLIMDVALARTGKWHIGNGYGWHSRNYYLAAMLSGSRYSSSLLLKPHGSLNWFNWPPKVDNPDRTQNVKDKELDFTYFDVRAPIVKMRQFKHESPMLSPPLVAPKLAHLYIGLSKMPIEKRKDMEGFVVASGIDYPKKIAFAQDLPYLVMPTPYKSLAAMSFGELRLVWQAIPIAIRSADKIVSIGFSFCDPHFNSILINATKSCKKRIPMVVVSPNMSTIDGMIERLRGADISIERFNGTFDEYVKNEWL